MAAEPTTVLYDDRCPLCTFQMRLLTWVDWFDTVGLMPMSHEQVRRIAPGLTEEQLAAAIHCVTPQGRVYRGARALRHVGIRMPLMFPVALLMWIPGVIQLAEVVYNFISRRRYVLSRLFGCRQACSVMPARKREQDATPSSPQGAGEP